MLRKIVTAIIVVPLLIVIVGFAVANRQAVTVSFDPFDQAHPASAVTLPLFVLLFVTVIVGVIVGGIASRLRHGHWRRASRRLEAELKDLHGEMDAIRRKFSGSPPPAAPPRQPPQQPPPLILPP